MKRKIIILTLLVTLLASCFVFANAKEPAFSLYRNLKDEGKRVLFGDVFESTWKSGSDIISIYPIADDCPEIPTNSRSYQDIFCEAWDKLEDKNMKISYRIEFSTSDGKKIDVNVKKPGDELSYRDYLENYFYDDVHVPKNTFYSHLEPDATGDIIMSSLKVTAGKKVDLINSPIKITATLYGNSGIVSDSVSLVRSAEKLSITKETSGSKVKIKSSVPMAGLYVKWDSKVTEWTLDVNGESKKCGEYGMIHDYIDVVGATECTINVPSGMKLKDVAAYSEGTLPKDVQVWEKPLDKADMLVFSTHADDEVLFFGGAITKYQALGYKTQVVYMCHYWSGDYGDERREHEKLDGLWEMGVRNYPVNMPFEDHYATTLEDAKESYDLSKVTDEVVKNIDRFSPLVIVTHDIKGEYGHGGHMLLYAAVADGVEKATWNTPKTYIHLCKTNPIKLELKQKMDELGGKTPFDVATAAYKKHETQQWTSFRVRDDNSVYSCTDFGLFRTNVGVDKDNNMFENVVSYAEQARIEEEKRREEEEKKKKEEEASKTEAPEGTDKPIETSQPSPSPAPKEPAEKLSSDAVFGIIFITAGAILAIVVIISAIKRMKKKH